MRKSLASLAVLGFVLLFTGAWGGFDDIDTTRYFSGSNGINVHRNAAGEPVMIVKDETAIYHDQVQNAITEWNRGDCEWEDADPATCPGVRVRPWVRGGPNPDMVVFEGSGGTWEEEGRLKIGYGWTQEDAYEVVLHEFGHALGFKHMPQNYACRTVMTTYDTCARSLGGPMHTPGDIDRALYLHRWIIGDWADSGVIVDPDAE